MTRSYSRLLSWGTNYMWYCQDCGRVLHKPQYRDGDNRFHSSRCRRPLSWVAVMVSATQAGRPS